MSGGEAQSAQLERQRRRVVRFLATGCAALRPAAREGRVILEAGERGAISPSIKAYRQLLRHGLVQEQGGKLSLTAEGKAYARRLAAPFEPHRRQHMDVEMRVIDAPDGVRQSAAINLAESPLGSLAKRRNRNGTPFLDQAEFDAGERLRADYIRGQIMPRSGANWMAAVAQSKRSGGPAGATELTEAALAARIRVETALDAVGPELAGVMVDICCFLKGFEQVEMERGWPVRSAKVVLKAALGALSRHYSPPRPRGNARRRILHWGAEGYRPSIKS